MANNEEYLQAAARVRGGTASANDIELVATMAKNPRHGANGPTVQACDDALKATGLK